MRRAPPILSEPGPSPCWISFLPSLLVASLLSKSLIFLSLLSVSSFNSPPYLTQWPPGHITVSWTDNLENMFLLYCCHPLSDLPRLSGDLTKTQEPADACIPTEGLLGDLTHSLGPTFYSCLKKGCFVCFLTRGLEAEILGSSVTKRSIWRRKNKGAFKDATSLSTSVLNWLLPTTPNEFNYPLKWH